MDTNQVKTKKNSLLISHKIVLIFIVVIAVSVGTIVGNVIQFNSLITTFNNKISVLHETQNTVSNLRYDIIQSYLIFSKYKLAEKKFQKDILYQDYLKNDKVVVEELENLKDKVIGNESLSGDYDLVKDEYEDYTKNVKKYMKDGGGMNTDTFLLDLQIANAIKYMNRMVTTFDLISKEEYNSLSKSADVYRRLNLVLGLILVSTALFSGITLYQGISRPTKDLATALKDISHGDGDLTNRLHVRKDDELGQIEISFNEFVQKIADVIHIAKETIVSIKSEVSHVNMQGASIEENISSEASLIEEFSAMTEEISSLSEVISGETGEQLAAITDMTKKMEVLYELVDSIKSEVQNTAQLSRTISKEAHSGGAALKKLHGMMTDIDNSSNEIATTVTVISEISEQINLLALNAAIEAARAGHVGKGFGVVADEISNLAEQTDISLKSINEFVSKNNNYVKNGITELGATVEIITKMTNHYDNIKDSIERINEYMTKQTSMKEELLTQNKTLAEMSERISMSTTEQTGSVEEIVSGIEEINSLAQLNVSSIREIHTVIKEIATSVGGLNETIEFFKV